MALRLRRGTDAERQLITPAEGELIYTTDTKSVYVGDGVTVGGIIITGEFSLGDLSEVDLSTPPTIGQVLKWDGFQFVPSDDIEGGSSVLSIFDLNDVFSFTPPDPGDMLIFDGSNFVSNRIRTIFGDDSSIILDTATNTFSGRFVGDGSQLTNLPTGSESFSGSIFDLNDVFALEGFAPDVGDVLQFDGANFISQKITRIEGADSTIMLDTLSNTFTGRFIGDGSQLTNLPLSNVLSIFDLNDVFALEGFAPDAGDVLQFDGANFISQKITQIEGIDSTIMLDTETNTFTGNFVGDGSQLTDISIEQLDNVSVTFPGNNDVLVYENGSWVNTPIEELTSIDGSNYRINIIGEDSSIIINTAINEVIANTGRFRQFISNPDDNEEIEFITEGPDSTNVFINANDNFGRLNFYRKSEDDISGDNLRYGQVAFGRQDENGRLTTALISSNRDFIWMGHRSNGGIQNEDILYMTNGLVGIGTITPEAKLDINGDAIVRGTIDAASFRGSLVADDSTTIVDAINGTISASSFIQFGSLTTLERNALTPVNGMVIYNTTDNKFQGYQNNVWINLDGS